MILPNISKDVNENYKMIRQIKGSNPYKLKFYNCLILFGLFFIKTSQSKNKTREKYFSIDDAKWSKNF